MSNIDFRNGTMAHLANRLRDTIPISAQQWQSQDVSHLNQFATYELQDVVFRMPVPRDQDSLEAHLGDDVNLDWAREHFLERVSGTPLNPPPSHKRWPWARHNGNHQNDTEQFSHTYPERMWPKYGDVSLDTGTSVRQGIRFAYGDLQDVINLLVRFPFTRQAYLPIWFPEDTGAHHGQRVPCTLGYHFMIRDDKLSMRYYMRSCDLIRHFADDVYLAARLMQWVATQVNRQSSKESEHIRSYAPSVVPGELVMYIASLHAFRGDRFKLREISNRTVSRAHTPE